ncbi:LLM class flavin-dependent oxidoreductase [Pseudomonadales bacterium]|jgi:probable F420-dependent oxidoreductase|nr:LLM class flavin-dependent oxidoreductase [Pseudomonadales bacterium]MDC0894892.1 LLM class flavin-dependent oxidoreductase [Pseudomonadales bacterium]MDC6449082.1 LLM class flavin-dependent oxidoreductase [Pseudomonadales bacterium]|tara:strand:+ start:1406 stop:2266 length:861 start_codon:yes stop_codon:yes gene_type:complete
MTFGIMIAADQFSTPELQEIAHNAERCGIDNLWVPELFGRDPFITCASLLSATENIRVGTAITNIYARDARAIKSAAYSLAEAHGNRFDLGIGLSNKVGNDQRGLPWLAPSKKLAEFIHYYNASPLMFNQDCDVQVYLAAHGPTLMNIAAKDLDGAYVYMKPVEYSRWAKEQLGTKKLHLMQITVLESDPEIARGIARKAISIYMPLTNYHRAWREAGFADEDFANGGSDHFIDSLIAWGNLEKISRRYQLQRAHGVDQIIISPANLNLLQQETWQAIESLIKISS